MFLSGQSIEATMKHDSSSGSNEQRLRCWLLCRSEPLCINPWADPPPSPNPLLTFHRHLA